MMGEARMDLERHLRAEHSAGDMGATATLAIREYGPEVLGLLVAVLRNHDDAAEVFAEFCEDLWAGLPKFRWESSMRTWAYTLARHAAHAFRRDPHRRRRVALSQHPEIAELEAQIRTTTVTYLRSEVKDHVSRLRESLDPDEQTLLVLRIDRQMSWNEIAVVMGGDASEAGGASSMDPARSAAMYRKRFERVKERLRALVSTGPAFQSS
jgi:RNA polymerase sigma-70 factor (ECF subfamily)